MKIIWIIAIVIFFFLIGGVILTILIVSNENPVKPTQVSNLSMSIYLKTIDPDQTSSNIIITNHNDSILDQKTTLESGWIQDEVNDSINIYCYDENHYMNKIEKTFTQEDINNKKSSIICSMKKTSDIQLSILSKLNVNSDQVLTINIDNYFRNPSICESHSAGIVTVSPPFTTLFCNNGFWLNYSNYDEINKIYTWLPESEYKCGEQLIFCDSINQNTCNLKQLSIPSRFNNLVDNCYQLGFDMNNESRTFNFKIKTLDLLTESDYINFYVYDNDLRYNNGFKLVNEVNGIEIASRDKEIEVDYER